MPVKMVIEDEERRPSIEIIFIIDKSGSMSDESGGYTKLDLAKEAVSRSAIAWNPEARQSYRCASRSKSIPRNIFRCRATCRNRSESSHGGSPEKRRFPPIALKNFLAPSYGRYTNVRRHGTCSISGKQSMSSIRTLTRSLRSSNGTWPSKANAFHVRSSKQIWLENSKNQDTRKRFPCCSHRGQAGTSTPQQKSWPVP